MAISTIIAYVLSVAVPAFAIYIIFLLDLFGTGKGNTVAVCLIWGATGAFLLSYAANTALKDAFTLSFEQVSTRVAPFVEELFKLAVLLYFVQRPRFRYFVDGAVYGYAVGIGFAMSENIFYLSNSDGASALGLAVTRVLSASLMHAVAGAVMGIALGFSRRAGGWRKLFAAGLGILFAMSVHLIYNSLLFALDGGVLLLGVAIAIGLGGGIMVGVFMTLGLAAEKRRFADTLGIHSGVSAAERKAVQNLGSTAIDEILADLAAKFGAEKAALIRQLLVIQANIGILKNNLSSPVGDRLRKAWQIEVEELSAEMDRLRRQIGAYTMTLLRSLLPEGDVLLWDDLTEKIADYDPMHVHSFDLFMVASQLSQTIPAADIERISNRLSEMPIFENVAVADLDNLSRAITPRQFSHGQSLFDKGDVGDAMFLIDRGYVDILTIDAQGQEKLLRTYKSGDVVGELALFDGQPRSARARANGPLVVMQLKRQDFMRFVQSRPKVILAVLRFLADRLRYTTNAVTGAIVQQVVITEDDHVEVFDFSPQVSDTVQASLAPLGVFGRLAAALDDLERGSQTR